MMNMKHKEWGSGGGMESKTDDDKNSIYFPLRTQLSDVFQSVSNSPGWTCFHCVWCLGFSSKENVAKMI